MTTQTTEPSTVVSIVDQIKDKKFIETYAKLLGVIEWHEKEIMKDPWPFLQKAAEQAIKFEKLREEIRRIVYPICHLHQIDMPPTITDVRQEAWEQIAKIKELVWRD